MSSYQPRRSQSSNRSSRAVPSRRVANQFARPIDKMTEVQKQTTEYDPKMTIYDQDYNKKGVLKPNPDEQRAVNRSRRVSGTNAQRAEANEGRDALPQVPSSGRAQTAAVYPGQRAGNPDGKDVSNTLNESRRSGTRRVIGPAGSNLKTNEKWVWEEGPGNDIEDLVPEDWCCIDKDPSTINGNNKPSDSGHVFPKYVNWGNPNQKSLYQQDYVPHDLSSRPKGPNNNPWGTFNSNEPMDMGTTSRVSKRTFEGSKLGEMRF